MLRKDQRSFVLLHCSVYYPCTFRLIGSSAGRNRGTICILPAFDVPEPEGNLHNHVWLNSKVDRNILNKAAHAYGYTAIHHFPSRIRSVKHALHPSSTFYYHTAPAHTMHVSNFLLLAYLQSSFYLYHIAPLVFRSRTCASGMENLFRLQAERMIFPDDG